MESEFETPRESKRLFELVKPNDPIFRIAFYYALKDTLVCQNIDTATAIGLGSNGGKRYRVVTIKGDLIEPSGTISGGGKPKSGGMSAQRVDEYSEHEVK